MKVAIVVHDFDTRFGQGRYCVELTRRLRERIELTVYANSCRLDELPRGVAYRHIPGFRQRALTTIFSFLLPAELAARSGRHDLIHAQGLSCWSADVITGHMCNAGRRERTLPSESKALRFMRWIVPWERRFYRQRRARHLISISRLMDREIRLHYGWNKPSTVIYHGTNTEQFRPAATVDEKDDARREFGLGADRWNWLFMGEAIKGLQLALEQLKAFPEAHLLVISRSDLAPYRVLAREEKVESRVIFHGFHSRPELAFRAADLFLYPNDYDPFGMVGAEAMASGLPVILGRDIGVAELVSDRMDGLLCDPRDPASIRSALRFVSNLADRGLEIGVKARESIREKSWEACASATFDVYSRVLSERSRT